MSAFVVRATRKQVIDNLIGILFVMNAAIAYFMLFRSFSLAVLTIFVIAYMVWVLLFRRNMLKKELHEVAIIYAILASATLLLDFLWRLTLA